MSSSGLSIHPVESRKDLLQFIRFPRRLYRDSPWYVPHLEFERKSFFNPAKNPFFDHAEAALFLLRSPDGGIAGRISAQVDLNYINFHGEKTGLFGFFDSVEDPGTAQALFEAAETFLRSKGMSRIVGPMSFTTNDEVGVLVRGFDSHPYLMMPYNFPYYDSLLRSCGLEKASDLYAYTFDYSLGEVPDFIRRVNERLRRSTRIHTRMLDMKHFGRELELVKKIYNSAWEENWGFVPMTDAEIDHMASTLKPLVDPRLVHFVFVDDEPAGLFLALPDYNQVLRKLEGRLFPFGFVKLLMGRRKIDRLRVLVMGVVKKYRRLGLETVLLHEIYAQGPKFRYRGGELSWILEGNAITNRICSRIGGPPYRTYRIYQKGL
jgi:GNAT superfamily N-acetyltransferase